MDEYYSVANMFVFKTPREERVFFFCFRSGVVYCLLGVDFQISLLVLFICRIYFDCVCVYFMCFSHKSSYCLMVGFEVRVEG